MKISEVCQCKASVGEFLVDGIPSDIQKDAVKGDSHTIHHEAVIEEDQVIHHP